MVATLPSKLVRVLMALDASPDTTLLFVFRSCKSVRGEEGPRDEGKGFLCARAAETDVARRTWKDIIRTIIAAC